jgi:hypothetical protein
VQVPGFRLESGGGAFVGCQVLEGGVRSWWSVQTEPYSSWTGCGGPAGQAGMKRWMAWLALSWNEAFRRSGKMSAWSATGPMMVLAALA